MTANAWAELKKRRERANTFTTPQKERKGESMSSLNLAHIDDSLKAIKNEKFAGRGPNELNYRIEKLENQIELLGERLEDWALDHEMKELQREQEKEDLVATLLKMQTQIGDAPVHIIEEAEPSIWANIATLVQKIKETGSFEASRTWAIHVQEYKALYTQFHSDKKMHEDFVQTVIILCTPFKNDLVHLNQTLRILKANVNLISSPMGNSQ